MMPDSERIITNLIQAKKSGECDALALVATFLTDSDAVILGCTELPLYVKNEHPQLLCPMQVQIHQIITDFF